MVKKKRNNTPQDITREVSQDGSDSATDWFELSPRFIDTKLEQLLNERARNGSGGDSWFRSC